MQFIKEYIRFDGRLNRKAYWLRVLVLIIIMILGVLIGEGLASATAPISGLVLFLFLTVFILVASLGIAVRRLHDRNKPGWWIIPFQFLPNVLLNMAVITNDQSTYVLFTFFGLALAIWGFIEMGILKGTDGSNQYGKDPLSQDK